MQFDTADVETGLSRMLKLQFSRTLDKRGDVTQPHGEVHGAELRVLPVS